MPSVSQVSTTVTPGAVIGTPACRTVAPGPGGPSTAEVDSAPATGAWLQNVFRPSNRYPPSTSVATVVGRTQSEPPLVARIRPSSATRRSTRSASGAPPRHRRRCSSVRYRCIAADSAAAPDQLPSSSSASSTWRVSAPSPPSSAGTASRRYPRVVISAYASVTNVASRSCCSSNGAAACPTAVARADTASSVIVVGAHVVVMELSVGRPRGLAQF
ncbi:hypothetical protein H7X46_21355 [Pseudonocardia sp. C8]|nr:hypothetical protein [Pseudonocardia sp. C8]MBC3193609.1 hypothetical protein [Pseudonocardia sp. C8]